MKKNKKIIKYFGKINLIMLAALMIIPGLSKLFASKATTVFLDSLGFPAAGFFIWVLILAEIGSGLAILLKWKLDIVKYIPVIVLGVAILTAHIGDFQAILIRLVLISNYLLLRKK